MSPILHTNKIVLYMIWNTESQSFDSADSFFDIEDAQTECELRNHGIQDVECLEDGTIEYVDNLPDVYEVRKVTVEKIKGL